MKVAITTLVFLLAALVAACSDGGDKTDATGALASPTAIVPANSGDPWEALRLRPLALPTPAPDSPCPITLTREVSIAFAAAAGDGPVYPVLGTKAQMELGQGVVEGGWEYVKVLWASDGRYGGPVLVRGGQIDGENELRFESGPDPTSQLELPEEAWAWSPDQEPGWREWPSYTRLRGPGCYAYQVDGTDFTLYVIFEAVLTASPSQGG